MNFCKDNYACSNEIINTKKQNCNNDVEFLDKMTPSFHPSHFEISVPTNNDISKKYIIDDTDIDKKKYNNPTSVPLNNGVLYKSNTGSLKNIVGETLLTFLFFSEQNINNIQNIIKNVVYDETKRVIDKQSNDDLLIVMRQIYMKYSNHPPLIKITDSQQIQEKLKKMYTNEIVRLDQIVVNETVPGIISNLMQYIDYLKTLDKPPDPSILKPIQTNISGTRSFRSPTQVFFGGNF